MRNKPKKSENNKNVVKKLQKKLRSILSIEKKRIDIELSFTDETEFLEIIDAFPPETTLQSLYDVEIILKKLDCFESIPFEGNEKIKAEVKGWDLLKYKYKELTNNLGKELTGFCFYIFYILLHYRLLYFMQPDDRDALYIMVGDLFEKDENSRPNLDQALENLSSKTFYKHKKTKGYTSSNFLNKETPKDVLGYVFESVFDKFRNESSLEGYLLKATKNHLFITENTKKKLIDEYRNHQKSKDDIGATFSLDDNPKLISDLSELSDLNDMELTMDLDNLINAINDPKDKKILDAYRNKNLETVRDIAEETGIPRSTVQDRIKKLRKKFSEN